MGGRASGIERVSLACAHLLARERGDVDSLQGFSFLPREPQDSFVSAREERLRGEVSYKYVRQVPVEGDALQRIFIRGNAGWIVNSDSSKRNQQPQPRMQEVEDKLWCLK